MRFTILLFLKSIITFVCSYNIPLKNFKNPYYFDNRVHNVGNIGPGGWLHAELSPFATKFIDNIRYSGTDIRKEVMTIYHDNFIKKIGMKPKILDLCCGVGISTFINSTGVDTSSQMINKARKLRNTKNINRGKNNKIYSKFKVGNAEFYGKNNQFDCVSIMFAMHEMPSYAHKNVIDNCKRISKYNIVIVDLSPNYKPTDIMLSGEPYLNDYLENFDTFMEDEGFDYIELVDNHARIWYY